MTREMLHPGGPRQGRARRAPAAWLAALMLTAATALGVLAAAPQDAHAQANERSETKVEEFKADRGESRKKEDLAKGPAFKGKAVEREFKTQAAKKRDEAIRLIRELIDATDDNDPEKPEFLFQLSELLWEKSKYYEQKAFKTQDDMYEAQDKKDEAGAKRYKQRMADELSASKRLREQAVQVYAQIIRNHKDFKDLDKVYFYLGVNLIEVGKRPQGLSIFRELIKNYPTSDYIPNVLLAFGDYYFDNDDMAQAQKAYLKVMSFEGSSVRAYAGYKLAWCHYNLTEFDKALNQFLDVVRMTEQARFANDRALRKEALRDIVQTYLHIGTPAKALGFFRKLVKSDTDVYYMAERLAQLYQDAGKFDESTGMYKTLIGLNKNSFKVMDYQLEIVRNVEAIGVKLNAVKELVRAMKLFEVAKKFKDADPATVADLTERLQQLLREYATNFHREAQQTKNPQTYALAYSLYKAYLESFPDSKDAYVMNFFYGELLYRVKKYDEAAAQYDKVIDMKPDGKYTKEAVHAAVLSYQKAVKVEQEAGEGRGGDITIPDVEGNVQKEEKKLAKKDIPKEAQNMIRACQRYAKFYPDGEDLPLVRYSEAWLYYEYNHFDKAIPAFRYLAYNHGSEGVVGTTSALLLLDSMLIEGQVEELADESKGLYKEIESGRLSDPDGKIATLIKTLAEKANFLKCTKMEDEEVWESAGQCFIDFYKGFPESDLVDKALWNAALDFERVKQIGKAVRVRIGLLKVRPKSKLAPPTIYNVAGNYHAIAVYSEASRFYEIYVKNFPKEENAEKALAFAATFRQGLGQYGQAIGAYNQYLDLFCSAGAIRKIKAKRPKKGEKPGPSTRELQRGQEIKCGEVFWQIGVVYEKTGKQRDALEHYQDYVKKWGKKGKPDRVLEASLKQGLALWKSGKPRKALDEFDKTLALYGKLSKDDKASLTSGADAAANAQFMKGEAEFQELAKIKLKLPEDKLKKSLEAKIKGYTTAEKLYGDIFKYQRPDWTLAALYRIGSLYQDFGKEIRNSPVPSGLTYDQEELYKGGLEEKASNIEQKAIAMFEKCLEAALANSWFNQYSRKSEAALADLMPGKYRKPSEMRADPAFYRSGFQLADFATEAIKADDATIVNEDITGESGGAPGADAGDKATR